MANAFNSRKAALGKKKKHSIPLILNHLQVIGLSTTAFRPSCGPPISDLWCILSGAICIWRPVARGQAGRPQSARHHCGLAVGSEPLVRVINLCNGPIRLQFRRLMTARCVKHALDSQLTGSSPSCREMKENKQQSFECQWKDVKWHFRGNCFSHFHFRVLRRFCAHCCDHWQKSHLHLIKERQLTGGLVADLWPLTRLNLLSRNPTHLSSVWAGGDTFLKRTNFKEVLWLQLKISW